MMNQKRGLTHTIMKVPGDWRSLENQTTSRAKSEVNEKHTLNPVGPRNRQEYPHKTIKINSFKSGPSYNLTPDPLACIKEGRKVINRDCVKTRHHIYNLSFTFRLSHRIYIISSTFVTYYDFPTSEYEVGIPFCSIL